MNQNVREFDTAIVGGGVIGCALAWRLGQAGQRVVVIERSKPGGEASSAAGGMLAPLAEADRADAFFELGVASRAIYADFARELREATGIDVEYRAEGTLYLALTEEDEEELEERWEWQHAAGLNVERLAAEYVRKQEPVLTSGLRWALKFPDDHQVDSRRLMLALVAAARQVGVEFWENTEALKLLIDGAPRRVTGVLTGVGELRSQQTVVTAGSWSSLLCRKGKDGASQIEVEPVRGQMVAVEMTVPPLRHVIYSRRGYVIPRLSGVLIAGSTTERAGFDRRVTAGGIASIIERAVEIVPNLARQEVREVWAGLRPHAPDDLPILGADSEINGLVYATGHYRNGILLTPITARLISQLLLGAEPELNLAPFSASRFTASSARV